MTSSHEKVRQKPEPIDGAAHEVSTKLPPALPSMWRLCKLGYRHEPRLMIAAFVLALLSALPDALLALWLALLGKGVQRMSLNRQTMSGGTTDGTNRASERAKESGT